MSDQSREVNQKRDQTDEQSDHLPNNLLTAAVWNGENGLMCDRLAGLTALRPGCGIGCAICDTG